MKWKGLSIALSVAMAVTIIPFPDAVQKVQAADDGSTTPLQLYYDEPAGIWQEDALPLGNGFLGAMVFGGVESDRLLINEHSLWNGGPGQDKTYDGGSNKKSAEENHANLQKARELIQEAMTDFTKNYSSYVDEDGNVVAEDYLPMSQELTDAIESLKGLKEDESGYQFGSYQPIGNLMIDDLNYLEEPVPEPIKIESNSWNQTEKEGVRLAFDNNLNTKWFSLNGTNWSEEQLQEMPCYIITEYKDPILVDCYTIVADASGNSGPSERSPKSWVLYGSTDGKEYKKLDEQNGVMFTSGQEAKTFKLAEPGSYQYLKIEFSENAGSNNYGLQIYELTYEKDKKEADYSNYKRVLDLDNATASVSYTENDINYNREYFVSNPGNFMAVKLDADRDGAISKRIYLSNYEDQSDVSITAENDTITMTGHPKDQIEEEHLEFAQQVKVIPEGGTMTAEDGYIDVKNANSIVVLMSAGTNYQMCMDDTFDYFKDELPLPEVQERVNAAARKDYDTLKAEHVADYKELFDRVELNLCDAPMPEKTTDLLLDGYSGRSGNPNTEAEDRYLETVYYQYGRYLLISSSREGSLPANLQGIWAEENPPWSADYHTNINIQMNYWLAEQTNLTECHEPVIEYIKSLVPRGTETAQLYHCQEDGSPVRGWTTYHENNIWGNTMPAVSGAFYAPAGAAWMVQDIWEHYAFTLDEEYLRENYETLKQAALFWVDNLVVDERDGTLVASPSWSPEHGPFSMGTTADQAIIWDVFNNTIKASEVLGDNSSEIEEIKAAQEKLSGPKIGLGGQYQEWKDEIKLDLTGDNGHRHANHLYGLHPGNQVVAGRSEQDDKYIEAMKVTLNTRGDGGTGWSKAWKINFWARLRDGDRAQKLLKEQLVGSTQHNLFDWHPGGGPNGRLFQIDGNFGATAGMTEMMLQSQGDAVELLPAMAQVWDHGSVSGLKARGNVEVDMTWNNGILETATLKPGVENETLKVRGDNIATSTFVDSNGQAVEYEIIDKDTIVFHAQAGETYTISEIRDEAGLKQAREDLEKAIEEAQELLDSKTEDSPLYDEVANKALADRIAEAKDILENSSSIFELNDETEKVRDEMERFNDAYALKFTIGLESGFYTGAQQTTVHYSGSLLKIYYTLDGSEPTGESIPYTGEIPLPYGITHLKVAAFMNGEKSGDTLCADYMINPEDNLALNKKVSSEEDAHWESWPIEDCVDGDSTTWWTGTPGQGPWTLEVDLGEKKEFDSIHLLEHMDDTEENRITNYTLEYFDGNDWKEIDTYDINNVKATQLLEKNDLQNSTGTAQVGAVFEKVQGSKVRITFKGNKQLSLLEFELYNSKFESAADLSKLQAAVDASADINPDNYVEVSEYLAALERAQTLLKQGALTEKDQILVDGAADRLNTAREALVPKPAQTDALKTLVDAAEKLNQDNYTEETLSAFTEALKTAKELSERTDLTIFDQGEVDDAYTALKNAMDGLIPRPGSADLRELLMAVERAEKLNLEEYFEEGKETFKEALKTAKELSERTDLTFENQAEIDQAAQALNDAMEALVKKADKTALKAAIEEAESLDLDKYTQDSVDVFKDALVKAKEVLRNEGLTEADQSVVDEALKNLKMAQANLKEKTDNGTGGDGSQTPGTGGSDSDDSSGSVQTGDTTKTAVPVAAMGISLLAIIGVFTLWLRRRRNHR